MKKSVYNYAFWGLAILGFSVFTANILATGFDLKEVASNIQTVENTSDNSFDFYGKEWKLTQIEGLKIESDKAIITFEEKSNSVGGNGGCNFISGKIAKNGKSLKFSKIGITVMSCQKGLEDEYKFVTALERIDEYEIKDGKLLLMENKTVVLEFEARN